MVKKMFLIAALVIAVSLCIGYAIVTYKQDSIGGNSSKTAESEKPQVTEPPKLATESPIVEKDPIKVQLSEMSMDEKIGQMVLTGLDGYEVDSNSKLLIEKYHVGGVILFKKNINNSNQLLSLLNNLKSTNKINKIPLFLSVDEEGGRVTRMPDELVKLPANQSIGQVNSNDFSFQIGSAIAQEIKAFGFNMDYAPVLDINSNPKNPVIGDRSFGSNADIVSRLGIQTMKGIQSQTIIPVVKHFPGHGDTSVDSHKSLPVVNNDLERLNNFELIPFKEAIRNGADAVMVAHILLPQIDPVNPASFSKAIINGILRGDLNFEGVVITDDMTMGAIANNYDIGDSAVKSINAGSDIVLVCHTFEKELVVIHALQKAVKAGVISKERVDESVYRILKLKQKYLLTDSIINSVDVKKINGKIEDVLKTYLVQ